MFLTFILFFITAIEAIPCFHKNSNNTLNTIECEDNLCQFMAMIDSSRYYTQTLQMGSPSCSTGEVNNNAYKHILQNYNMYKVKYLCLLEHYDYFIPSDYESNLGDYMYRCICNEPECNSMEKMLAFKFKLKLGALI